MDDRDDPNYPQDQNPEDDSALQEGSPAEDEASPEEENWNEPPADDFADPEQAFAEEHVEANEGTELPHYAEGDAEEPAEDYPSPPEGAAEGEEGASDAHSPAEQYMQRSSGGVADLMKYLPYVGAGVLLLIFGIFGVQQIQHMTAAKHTDSVASLAPPQGFPVSDSDKSQENSHTPAPMPPPSIAAEEQQKKIISPVTDTPTSQASAETRSTDTMARGPDYVLPGSVTTTTPEAVSSGATAAPGLRPAPSAATAMPSTPPQPSAAAPGASALEEQLSALSRQLEDIKKNQDRMDEQLRNMQSSSSAAPSEEVKSGMHSLEEKISQLEQRFGSSGGSEPKAEKAEKASSSEDKPAPRKARKKKRSKELAGDGRYGAGAMPNGQAPIPPQTYATGPYQWAAPQPMMVPVSRPAGWLLRSAQPGAAWLSQGMSTDLRRVVPGDKIDGLGTIVSIRMVAGRWLVEGTQGSVR